MRSLLVIEPAPHPDERRERVSFHVDATLTKLLRPGDALHFVTEGRSCIALSIVRDSELIAAVGALSMLDLGTNVSARQNLSTQIAVEASLKAIDPRFDTIELPIELTIGREFRLLQRGHEYFDGYYAAALQGYRAGFYSDPEAASLVQTRAVGNIAGWATLALLRLAIEDESPGQSLGLEVLPGAFALARLPGDAEVPAWAAQARRFLSITRSPAELSVLADREVVPEALAAVGDYRGIRVAGELPLAAVGILADLSGVLAQAGIALFPIATHDTDWLFVRDRDLTRAILAFELAGHIIDDPNSDS